MLVCRVALGFPMRTRHNVLTVGQAQALSMDTNEKLFPITTRELGAVPNISPPIHYHSLVAHESGWHEFILFHGEYIYPEYVLAFKR